MSTGSVSSSDDSSVTMRTYASKKSPSSVLSSISDSSTEASHSVRSHKSHKSTPMKESDSALKGLMNPDDLNYVVTQMNFTVTKQMEVPRIDLLSKVYNSVGAVVSHMSNMTQSVVDVVYSKLLLAINKKLVDEIHLRKTLETEITKLEADISDIAHKEYAADFVQKHKHQNPYDYTVMHNFLFKTTEGIAAVRKIHKHYMIDYYVLKHGDKKNEAALRTVYEDSIIPIALNLEKQDPEISDSDKQKMNAFKFNIYAYFAQALCYDEVAGKGIDLLQNEFTVENTSGENHKTLTSIINDICVKTQPLTKKKRSKAIMDDAEADSPGDYKLHVMKKYKKEVHPKRSMTKKRLMKTQAKYLEFLNPKRKRQTMSKRFPKK